MRKLSFEEKLRHRLAHLPRFRYRDEDRPVEGVLYLTVGAVAGMAAGMLLAQKYGGFGAITSRLRGRYAGHGAGEERHGRYDGGAYDEEEFAELTPLEELEERVLDAYHNDPVLCERAIDIGAIDEGIIELTGWVHSADEATHAVTVARGTPGVETVVNRIVVREDEDRYTDQARRFAEGDEDLTEARWEGQQVGIGRSRQGNSADPGRHASPKVPLEERWLTAEEGYREAAEDIPEMTGERPPRRAAAEGDRTGGAPITPTGVPKGDHVADPLHAPQAQRTGNTEAPRGD